MAATFFEFRRDQRNAGIFAPQSFFFAGRGASMKAFPRFAKGTR